jgi:hypothetical protein
MMRHMLAKTVWALFTGAVVLALFWAILIATPMWLTRWRMSHLLADYHRIHPTQSTWGDAQKLMSRWGRWGQYKDSCSSTECDYGIYISDTYAGLVEKLSEKNQRRIYNLPFPMLANRIGYRTSEMNVHFLVLDGKIVRTNSSMLIMVADSGPPDHFAYPILITAQTRSNLSEYPRFSNHELGVMRFGVAQLDLHPDYQVNRPSSSKTGIIDHIAYTPHASP